MGNNENVALELIVRTGDEEIFSRFVRKNEIPESTRTEKNIETLIYSAIKRKGRFKKIPFFHPVETCKFLSDDSLFKDYFDSTENTTLLKDLVDPFIFCAEHYKPQHMPPNQTPIVVQLLGIKYVLDAIKRNIDKDYLLQESMKKYIQASYCAVLSLANSKLAKNIDHYLALLEPWELFMDPLKVVKEFISEALWLEEQITSKDNYDNFCVAVNKLIEFTDRSTVSRLFAEAYGEAVRLGDRLRGRVYSKLVKDGVIDKCELPEKHGAEIISKSVQEYENAVSPYQHAVDTLRERIGKDGKVLIAYKLAEWFENGKMEHIQRIIEFGSGLYDKAIARKVLGKAIKKAIYQNDWEKLDFAVEVLPENLIDTQNPTIKTAILPAYRVIHKGN